MLDVLAMLAVLAVYMRTHTHITGVMYASHSPERLEPRVDIAPNSPAEAARNAERTQHRSSVPQVSRFILKMPSFYQDRLGTNIGKAAFKNERRCVFL